MATEATFTIPAHEFPLGSVFTEFPDATVELERIVPGKAEIIPYLWVHGVETEDIIDDFAPHPGVKDIRLVDDAEDEHLLRVTWDPAYVGVLSTLNETGATLISAVGRSEHWTFELRGDDHRDISDFQRLCKERDIPVTLTALHALTHIETATEAALTDAQQDALVLAIERGYFEDPREVTLEELGEELGISQQAVGSRIRRGLRSVLNQTLTALDEDAPQP